MSKESTNFNRSGFYLTVRLSGTDGIQYVSPEVVLSDIPWRVIIGKKSKGTEEILKMALVCSSPNCLEPSSQLQWSCEATATVSTRSVGIIPPLDKKTIPTTQFRSECCNSKFVEIIRAPNLTQYMQNGCIGFDIQLFVNPLFIKEPSQINNLHTKFQFVVDNVRQLCSQRSSDINMRETTWYVRVDRSNNDVSVYLGQYYCRNENWSWNAKCTIKLLSFDQTVRPISHFMQREFCPDGGLWGFNKFVDWNILSNPINKFVQDDKAIFEIDLQVEPPKPLWNFDVNRPEENSVECTICLQSVRGRFPAATKCGHVFCYDCIKLFVQISKKCPNCKSNAAVNEIRKIFI